ncbi:hypothetical protein SH2C18_41250 [Clostridium sediminicola]|uniref:SpoIID/LytB domain-containing protein n=1 Tax=Clostridium sediminicola TaxID=3114879 RepID=UPI0031F27BE0
MKYRFLYVIPIIVLLVLIYIFYPRTIENGVIVSKNSNSFEIYTKGELKTIPNTNSKVAKFQVVNCKYNKLLTYKVHIKEPYSNRVMLKSSDKYELEHIGNINLNKKTYYYKIDSNNEIHSCTSKDLIIGKNNNKSYPDKNGFLHTFLIYPIDYSKIRVAISDSSFTSIYHKKLTIKPSSQTKLINFEKPYSCKIEKDSEIVIEFNDGHINIDINEEKMSFDSRIYLKGNSFIINEITRGWPRFNAEYKDTIELFPTDKGIILINELPTEEYLNRVVPSEMPTTGGLQSLKCQAVAARTYAISDMLNNRYAKLGFHVDDSTKSQVYNNTLPKELTSKAVKETEGEILIYNNKPIDAKYYSTSCGYGTDFKNIWFRSDGSSSDVPYLSINDFMESKIFRPETEVEWLEFFKDTELESYDKISPYFRWNVIYPKDLLEMNLKISLLDRFNKSRDFVKILVKGKEIERFPKEIGNLQNILVTKRSSGGNIIEISFVFRKATINIRKDNNVRRCFNDAHDISDTRINIERGENNPLKIWDTLPSSFFSIQKTNDSFIVYGGGFGHGVGMSQYGTMYLSKNNYKYDYILKYYYKGTNIVEVY